MTRSSSRTTSLQLDVSRRLLFDARSCFEYGAAVRRMQDENEDVERLASIRLDDKTFLIGPSVDDHATNIITTKTVSLYSEQTSHQQSRSSTSKPRHGCRIERLESRNGKICKHATHLL